MLFASGAFPLNESSKVIVGTQRTCVIQEGDTLIELAYDYDIGYNEITSSNDGIDPWIPPVGTEILLPTEWILPEIYPEGIVINLAEMRLYYYPVIDGRLYVITYPIGIGRQGFNTPYGVFFITEKVENPIWYITERARKDDLDLPAMVPPGPNNPLGRYWMQLSLKGYGLHGTNKPYGIGRRVSQGCIRLYPEDMKTLFRLVQRGTKVKIVDALVKAGFSEGQVYVEVHGSGIPEDEQLIQTIEILRKKKLLKYVNPQLLTDALRKATGLPTDVTQAAP